MKRFRLRLHHVILVGIVLGAVTGALFAGRQKGDFVYDACDTAGDIFINLLKMVMVPLVVASLVTGMLAVGDPRKLGRIGLKSLVFYLATTVMAITIGLVCVNVVRPHRFVSAETRQKLEQENRDEFAAKSRHFGAARSFTIWDFLKGLVPSNPFRAMADEPPQMLAIIVFAVLIGLAAALLGPDSRRPFETFMASFSEVMIRLVQLIMWIAPLGAFALIARVVMKSGVGILTSLVAYTLTVLLAYIAHFAITYGAALRFLARRSFRWFLKGMSEAFLTAFSTSASAATLPVNLKCVRENLGVPAPIANFCLPLGATINMDGTSIMQAVASVFIGTLYLGDVPLSSQLTILLTATLASIGTAPVPGVGIVMLAVILAPLGIPLDGIALILGVDRFLDMCRTVLNIAGDAVCAVYIAASERELPA